MLPTGSRPCLLAWGVPLTGCFSPESAPHHDPSITLSNATIHEGEVMNLRNALNNVILSAGIIYHGGEVIWPRGLTLTAA